MAKSDACSQITSMMMLKSITSPRTVEPAPRGVADFSLSQYSIIIAVGGACPGNGSDGAVGSACGIFFGHDNEAANHNLSLRIPHTPEYPHTNQRAELQAVITALEAAHKFVSDRGQWPCETAECVELCKVKYIIIKSDSAYVVNNAVKPLLKWLDNGWRTARGTLVANQDLWNNIVILIGILETAGAGVDFWHVRREFNADADQLARKGMRSNICVTDFGFLSIVAGFMEEKPNAA
ncbi:ribonuclease H-like domain-containing protein [Xylariales sp. PMI_506]|nr:ribonuclease H-like domain-containing protein [Xylariales sp. PMI_506]